MSDYSWLQKAPGFKEWAEKNKPQMEPLRVEVSRLGEDRWQATVPEVEGAQSARATVGESVFAAAGEALQALGRKMVVGDLEAINRALPFFEVFEPHKAGPG